MILQGDALARLRELPDESVHCIITSPPYWGLRDYGVDGQMGLEKTLPEFLAALTAVFREARRVLRADGTAWVNMGDSWTQAGRTQGVRGKELVGQPWRLAFALQDDGWYLRQGIVWEKPNCMPESHQDRFTNSHEFVFLLAKSPRYYFNQEALMEPASEDTHARYARAHTGYAPPGQRAHAGFAVAQAAPKHAKPVAGWDFGPGGHSAAGHARVKVDGDGRKMLRANPREIAGASPGIAERKHPSVKNNASFNEAMRDMPQWRKKRSVWRIPSKAYPGAHFATFPPELVEPCLLAGCPPGGTVLDCFAGSGTVGEVAIEHARQYVLIELNPEYVKQIEQRLSGATYGLPAVAV